MNIPNPELELADDFVQHTNRNIFLTGKAGTGKTTFLHNIRKQTSKRLIVTAPTGVAAINAGGVTLHSFFQLPFGPMVPGSETSMVKYRYSKEKKNIIKSLDLLVIDEISMVRADLLDGVDSVLRRFRRNDQPFGGVQLLMIGDLHQLSPVVKDTEWGLLRAYYDSAYFFSSIALGKTELVAIELQHIYRQSDSSFIDLLNRVRDNRLDAQSLSRLNSRYIKEFTPDEEEGYITLCTHNSNADAINEARLAELSGKSHFFTAELDGDFPQHTYPTAASLELKIGAQVMFVRNDNSPEKRYFNGKIGTVVAISKRVIEVSCSDDPETIEVERATWENIAYSVNEQTAEISQKVVGTFGQYPIKLAWAITIHKSQGLTFDRAVIDAQAAFAHGQVYVALSRCRTFEGMVLSSPLGHSAIKSDATVNQFVERARADAPDREALEGAKISYQQQLLLECFSFGNLRSLIGRFASLLSRHAQVIQVAGGGDIGALHAQSTAEICTIGENFKRQLQGMFSDHRQPTADPAILERLAKASVYFQEKIESILLPCLDTIEVETDNKEIRKRITNLLTYLREETAVKLAAVRSCRDGFSPAQYLRALSAAGMEKKKEKKKAPTVQYTEADVGHPELFETLREWRKQKATEENVAHFQVLHQKTLVEITIRLPETIADLKKVKGIGKKLAERYGEELVGMVSDYRQRHGITEVILPEPEQAEPTQEDKPQQPERGKTRDISLDLFREGLSIAEIAEKRGLVTSTIEGHLAFFVKKGELAIDSVIEEKKREDIEEKISRMGRESLKELKIALGDDCSYGEIKLVLSHLDRDQEG